MGFCTNCGSPLNDNQQFCTNCGTRVGEAAPAAGAAQTAPLGTVNVAQPTQAISPQATQAIPFQNTQAIPPQATTYAAVNTAAAPAPGAPSPLKQKLPLIIAIVAAIVVIGVAITALSCSGVLPFGNNQNSTQAAVATPPVTNNQPATEESADNQEIDAADSQADQQPEGAGSNEAIKQGIKDGLDKRETAAANENEQDIYRDLMGYYDGLDAYNDRIAQAATTFNENFLKENRELRANYAAEADELYDEIANDYDWIVALDIPSTSVNAESREKIETCYFDCLNRIGVICEAWSNSLSYDKPSQYEDQILEPIMRDSDGKNNMYLLEFNETYPLAKPVEPAAN